MTDFEAKHPRRRDGKFTTKKCPVGPPVDIVTEPGAPDGTRTKEWWANAPFPLHRPDGPAIEGANGDKELLGHDEHRLPREDGPAINVIERPDGTTELYWWDGRRINLPTQKEN